MSYIVIARRWRPQTFTDIIGQDHVSKTLTNAIANDHIAHSFIFSGPRGVGKTTSARLLAKALNCEKGPTATPCNECSNCTSITKGNSLDVLEIDGASNRGIDEIRNLRENIRFSPGQSKYRIYIIDEVHMLTKEAFNALLKTLEEPPSHAVFIFATTEIHRVPPTILSRCQRFDFKRIPTKTIMEHLRHICDSDKVTVEEDALLQIAKKADGSMRDAQSILDQIISYSGDSITAAGVADALGIINLDIFFDFSNGIREGDSQTVLKLSQKILTEGYDLGEFLTGFEEHFRNLLVCRTLGSADLLNVAETYTERYLSDSKLFKETDLLRYIQIIGEMQNSTKWASMPHFKFELGLLKMTHMPEAIEIETILEKLELLKKKTESVVNSTPAEYSTPAPEEPEPAPAPITEPEPEKTVTIPPFDAENFEIFRNQMYNHYKNKKVRLAHAFEVMKLAGLTDNAVTVEFNRNHNFHFTVINNHVRDMEDLLHRKFKKNIKVTVQLSEELSEDAPQPKPVAGTKPAEDDPMLNKLIDELGLELT